MANATTIDMQVAGVPRWLGVWLAVLVVMAMPTRAQTSNPNDPQARAAAEGKAAGQGMLGRAPVPNHAEGGDRGQGTVIVNGQRLDVNDLVPGGTPAASMRLQALVGASEQSLIDAGAAERQKLASDPSQANAALREVGETRKEFGALANDAELWRQSERALARQHPLTADLGGCEARLDIVPAAGPTLVQWHEKTCEMIAPLDRCERERQVEITQEQRTVLSKTYAITADTQIQVPMQANPVPGEQIIGAQALVNWTGTVANAELTALPAANNNWVATVTVTGTGTLTLEVDARLDLLKETFTTPDGAECLLESDGFCTARWTCTDDDTRTIAGRTIDTSFAAILGNLYPNGSAHNPPDSLSPICWKAEARYDCPMNIGAMECWTNPRGEQVCHENTTNNTVSNTCSPLEENPQCQLLRSQCAQDGSGANGHCYVMTRTYRCGENVPTEGFIARTASTCQSNIRCMGEDCFNMQNKEEPVRNIAKGMAQMNLVQHLIADYDPEQARTKGANAAAEVEVMGGEPYECRKALGGLVDCCSETTNTDGTKRWIEAYQTQQRQVHAKQVLGQHGSEEDVGSWEALSSEQPTLDALRKAITGKRENVTGGEATYEPTDRIAQQGGTLEVLNKALVAEAKEEHMLDSGYMCSAREWELAQQKETGNCASIGSYCKRSVLGACIEKREVYCCFNSPLSRMVREQAIGQAGILAGAFGTPKAPKCDGVPMEVVTGGNLKRLVLDEWEARLHKAGVVPTAADIKARTDSERLTGRSSLLGQEDRRNLHARTQDRVIGIDGPKVNLTLDAQARSTMDTQIGTKRVPGDISIEGAILTQTAGRPVRVRVARRGDLGRVVVGYTTVDGTAIQGVNYDRTVGALVWEDGERGDKTITIPTRRFAGRPPATLTLMLTSPSGGARIHPIDTAEITLKALPFRGQ